MPQFILDHGSRENALAFRALPSFTQGYLEAALWTEEEQLEEEGLESVSLNDLAPSAWAKMVEECEAFRTAHATALDEAEDDHGRPMDHLGHDFWLSRNGHGTGFWDRGLGELGDRLHAAAEACGSRDLYVGDDGKVYVF